MSKPKSVFDGLVDSNASSIDALEAIAFALLKMTSSAPRFDVAKRLAVNVETGSVTASLASNQTLAAVATVSNLGASSKPADAIPVHLSRASSAYLYRGIEVS
jgi:hypothetical protein